MSYFDQYEKHIQNLTHFKTSFELHNVPLYVANSLRRSFSSNVPTTAFDDTYYDNPADRSINIKTNTSALHNEFLSHRLSLVPINMEMPNILIINTKQEKNGKRHFLFDDKTEIPTFTLDVKNNAEQQAFRDKNGIIEVTTDHFKIHNAEGSIDQYMLHDPFTKRPIVLNKLKYNISDPLEGDHIDLVCIPTIGQGKQNARYDPTGTVTFQYKVEESKIDSVFEKKLAYLKNERKSKNLDEFSNIEIEQLKTSFNLLDKNRVYHRDQNGDPSIFELSVESIGFMNPDQIIFDGISVLYLMVKDVINSINLSVISEMGAVKDSDVNFSVNSKVKISDITNSDNIGINVNIKNENHTLGNLVSSTVRDYYCGERAKEMNLLAISSYKMQHPTIEELDIILVPHTSITKDQYIKHIYNIVMKDEIFLNELDFSKKLETLDIDTIRKVFCTMLFVKSLFIALNKLNDILTEFSELSGVVSTTFNIIDNSEYFTKNSWCTDKLSEAFGVDLSKSTKPVFNN